MVFGTISDYPGDTTKRYRRVARQALQVADRVVFVGQQAGHMDRFRQGEAENRLFTFGTSYQASDFLARVAVPGELILIKGSLTADHLERIMLSQLDRVVCWRERCGYKCACLGCKEYRNPTPPPCGLSGQQSAVA